MDVKQALSIVILRERKQRKLTQQEVCKRGELGISSLRDIEHARVSPMLSTFMKVAKGLGIDPVALTKEIEIVLADSAKNSRGVDESAQDQP